MKSSAELRTRAFAIVAVALVCALSAIGAPRALAQRPDPTIVNGDAAGRTLRFDTDGNAIDAHDGEIQRFGDTYYLYGTSYGCGFAWQTPGSPFCGFRVYSSPDLVRWTDRGPLFDATTPTWQQRCNGSTYGCFRPHVVYNAKTKRYVLWINTYDVSVGYRVFTARSPTGLFTEQAVPRLAVNDEIPPGVNNGDHDVFVDRDGTAYLAFTDWRTSGELIVEKLDRSYLSGTGEFVRLGTRNTEAPSLFRRGNRYYVTYSDPNCGYCATGTSYVSAPSPLGPWTGSGTVADTWRIRDGVLEVSGGDIGLSRAGADWTDSTMRFTTTPLQTGENGRYAQAGWVFRAADSGTAYAWMLGNYPYAGAEQGSLTKVVFRNGAVASNTVVPLPFAVRGGESHAVQTTVSGTTITTAIDGQTVDTTTDTALSAGRFGFRENGSESALFDDVRVTALDGRTLLADDFSGDLSQWDRPPAVISGTKLTTTSCGGQPADVAHLPGRAGDVYLFQSDRWNNGARNEALTTHYWEPLRFGADGEILPLRCEERYRVPVATGHDATWPWNLADVLWDAAGFGERTGDLGFRPYCDVAGAIERAQTFTVRRSGTLARVALTSLRSGAPSAPLQLRLVRVGADGSLGATLATRSVPAPELSWAPSWVTLRSSVRVRAHERFALVSSAAGASGGCYGMAYSDGDPYARGDARYSNDGGANWRAEQGRDLHLRVDLGFGWGRG
ncbi:family 43 glycosylhydrolase [Conexibacter sp. CPCC 206217]|uniref:family 43 glycosylhydrolase n=1 Tax=Conexibacter sp. CPCC 206217 TaxID=3064574 RepID=UPI002725C91E|nr:family 43 glycosylhydrolase [Conexibacter sp. CPCC 206217]MDO8211073.1 family 43 glycosylhydrolase [Conexibacter sp. CPCC 206217]